MARATTKTHRPDLIATRHVAVAGHPWAATAAFAVLEAGGNAVDAGVAAGVATDVLESEFVCFGGVAPSLVYMAEGDEMAVVAGIGTWPAAASCAYFNDRFGGRVPPGVLRSVVPAAPDAWLTALERWGTMSFGDVAAAAIRFARDGFPMYPFMRDRIADKAKTIRGWPSTAAIFLPGGGLPAVGDRFVQADLAATLQYLADEERAAAGKGGRAAGLKAAREAFYRGDVARAIVRFHESEGGLLSAADMAGYRVKVETPCRSRFGDIDLYGCGPWSQGPMVLQALALLERAGVAGMAPGGAEHLHAIAEALKLAAADRESWFGDPEFVDVPVDALLSAGYLDRRVRRLDMQTACPEMPPAGSVDGRRPRRWRADPSAQPAAPEPPPAETSFLCVVDGAGNVFASTPSDGTVTGPVVPGTGIIASQWGSRAYTDPAHPACVGPGRRPRMAANPALAIAPGRFVMPFGSPGSEVLGQAMVQAFVNVAAFGMSPQEAVEAPRIASYSWPGSAIPHAYAPGRLMVERGVAPNAEKALSARGHDVGRWPEQHWAAGSVAMIRVDLDSGLRIAGADPRRQAYAVGW
ncbi:MAG: gamma-glutamyltransferase [Acetobacterales bacterium]